MKVLITRAEPAASRSKAKLKAAGFSPICLPLFEIVPIHAKCPEQQFDGYIFTSANSIRSIKAIGWHINDPEALCYCVGETTAEMARNAGFRNITTAHGGGSALAKLMIDKQPVQGMNFLFPTTPDRSYDMVKALPLTNVKEVHVYQTRKIIPTPTELSVVLKTCGSSAALSYSAKSAKHLETLIHEYSLEELSRCLSHVTISSHVSSELNPDNWKLVTAAELPNETSMIEKLNLIAKSC